MAIGKASGFLNRPNILHNKDGIAVTALRLKPTVRIVPNLHSGNFAVRIIARLATKHEHDHIHPSTTQMSYIKVRQECHLTPRGWRDSIDQLPPGLSICKRCGVRFMIAHLFALLFASIANAQTATVSVYAPPMPVLKKGVGLWQCQREVCVVTVVYSDGKKLSTRAPIGIPVNEAVIPVTWVRGTIKRVVDPCVCEGVLDNGDKITINLPREPVVFSRLEKQGLRLRVVVVAVPIDCPTVLTRSNGERFEGSVTFLACEAHGIGRGARLADATTTPDAVLTLVPEAKKIAATD
jgi:hypothetical protein